MLESRPAAPAPAPDSDLPAFETVPSTPPISPKSTSDGAETMEFDNPAPSGEDLGEQQLLLNSFQQSSTTEDAAQPQAPTRPQASISKSVRFSNSPLGNKVLGNSILGAPKTSPRPTVATAPAQPPRGPPRPPTIVISEPSPSPWQPPRSVFPSLSPWDRQYPNKAGALLECSFRPLSPCIEEPHQTWQRLQLGSLKLNSTLEGQQELQEICAHFGPLYAAPEYLGTT